MYVKNWEKYQNNNVPSPPWIKLHAKILNKSEFFELSGDAVKMLMICWVLASEDKTMSGQLPCIEKIAFRARMTKHETWDLINELYEFIDMKDVVIDKEDKKRIEAERETETEAEAEAESNINNEYDKLNSRQREILETFKRVDCYKRGKGKLLLINAVKNPIELASILGGETFAQIANPETQVCLAAEWTRVNTHKSKKHIDSFLRNWFNIQLKQIMKAKGKENRHLSQLNYDA